ncbi:MAG: hypothetical protein GY711_04210 [bacterium]|nr:hypothetical protein [bacterium]
MALIAVTVVSMLAAAFLQVSTATTRLQVQETENARAFYLAEAGLSEAYQGLRVGRKGQIGSATAPARYGNGLLWVDATEQLDGRVRLESTGMCGTGRATLALVVEPMEIPLGFFSDEDLTIESVLLVDGYDSSERTYDEEVASLSSSEPSRAELWEYADWLQSVIGNRAFRRVVIKQVLIDPAVTLRGKLGLLTIEELGELAAYQPYLVEGYPDGYDAEGPVGGSFGPDAEWGGGTGETSETSSPTSDTLGIDHTLNGALIGSNGSIALTGTGADAPEVFGDVVPGAGGQVVTYGDAVVTGDTTARTETVDLPAVEVPAVDMLGPVVHDSAIPMVVSPSTIGYASITVATDAELIVRGPCKLVVGMLELEPGADILLDTTDGEVQLYVTGGMNLAPGSALRTSGEQPEDISIQVGEIAAPVGDAPVKLESTAQFHGTIYAPNTAVRVGSAFEVFGGMVAKSLELAPGVKLHFDNAGYEGSPLPKLLLWKIVELPSVARRRGDPFDALSVAAEDLQDLAEAHDLTGVYLFVSYLDHSRNVQEYEGFESEFDWDLVAEVITSKRSKDASEDEPAANPGPTGVRQGIQDKIDLRIEYGLTYGGEVFIDNLIEYLPLSSDEWSAIYDIPDDFDPAQLQRLRDEDTAAGGMGG